MGDVLLRDIRLTLRTLRGNPGFTAVAVLTLALGIGATTAIFTLVQQVMLRQLAVTQPDRLWRVGDAVNCCHGTGYAQNDWGFFPWEAYLRFRAGTPDFEQLAAFQVGNAELGLRRYGSAAPIAVGNGEYVSGNFFRTLGISAWRGRLLADDDDNKSAAPVAVMSFRAWQRQFGLDPSVVGASYEINGHAFTIVGVAPPDFLGVKLSAGAMPDFWLPLSTEPLLTGATSRLENTGEAWLDLIGRVKPGADPKTLEARLQVELRQWLASHASDMTPLEKARLDKQTLYVTPGGGGVSLLREEYQDGLRVLLLAAASLLLVACANIANLLLARGLKDRPRTALRAALGASRARLVCQALVESLTLSVLGAVAGVAVAYGGATLILGLAFGRPDVWVPVNAAPSTPVLLFALAISVLTGVVFGMAPALMTSHAEPIEALAGTSRSAGGRLHWAQKALVIAQTAASLVLLSAAVMLGESLRNLERRPVGFDTNGRYIVWTNALIGNYKPEQLVSLERDIENRLRTIPGVRGASPVQYAPMSGYDWARRVRIEGQPEPGPQDNVLANWTRVTPRFFETVGDRVVAGRALTDADNADARPVAVINEAFARRFFGTANPIGRHFGILPRPNAAAFEIVGVVSDIRFFSDTWGPIGPMYFVPEAQGTRFDEPSLDSREVSSHYPYGIVVWAPGNPRGLETEVVKALGDVAPNLVVYRVQPYADVIRGDFAQTRMLASLAWLFGAVGLVLAAVGLYGVTTYGVQQRTGEIGVRMALGADRASVLAMVLRGAFWQVAIGVALGIPSAIGAGHLIANQLFEVQPWDPAMLAAAAIMLGAAATIAAMVPARRAMRVDPMVALRCE